VQTYQSPGVTVRFMYYYYTHLTCVIAILGHILKGKGTLFFTYFIYELRKCDVTDDMPKEKKNSKKRKRKKEDDKTSYTAFERGMSNALL
jgi:hypothetical protein